MPALTSVAYGLLQLGALVRYGDQVQWHEAGAWIGLALLNAIVTGGYQLLATADGTVEASASVRLHLANGGRPARRLVSGWFSRRRPG